LGLLSERSIQVLKELLRSNDLVLLLWIQSVLGEANIEVFVIDEQMTILAGSAATSDPIISDEQALQLSLMVGHRH
jgi:hypothetical protein